MKKFVDLTGQRFGRLVAAHRARREGRDGARYMWVCHCDCGQSCLANAFSLTSGRVRSCGCLKSTPNKIYSIGGVSICLMQGRKYSGYFWFDTEDYDLVSNFQWHVDKDGYAVAYLRGSGAHNIINVRIAKVILGLPYGFDPDVIVDHINGDICDNRKCNLRVCTTKDNVRHKKNVRGYYRLCNMKYGAHIAVDGQTVWLGSYETPEEAAAAYKAASILYHKEFGAHDGYIYYPGCPHE